MLRKILRVNALSCLVFGSLFVLKTPVVLSFLETKSLDFLISILGFTLLLFAIHLICASFRKLLIKNEILYFALGDILWVALTIILLLFSDITTSTRGVIASLLVALMVGAFGLMQMIYAKRINKQD